MTPYELNEGDTIADSPVGPGVITDFSERGYPRVNRVAVAYLRRTDGLVFDPHGHYAKEPTP